MCLKKDCMTPSCVNLGLRVYRVVFQIQQALMDRKTHGELPKYIYQTIWI